MDQLDIKIIENNMKVLCYIHSNSWENACNYEAVEAGLKEHGIKYGIKKTLINQMITNRQFYRWNVVAFGQSPINGKDGFYEFEPYLLDGTSEPAMDENGRFMFRNKRKLVSKGDLIARYIPARQGSFGYDVFGNLLKPERAKDLPELFGLSIEKMGCIYISKEAGRVIRDGYEVKVTKALILDGDLDHEFGNMDVMEDIIINGNVENGISIKSARSICIRGSAEKAYISAGEGIVVEREARECWIKAGGNFTCAYIDDSKVRAGGDVEASSIYKSEIHAHGRVRAMAGSGSILFGKVAGLLGVEAVTAGKAGEAHTEIYAGVTPMMYTEMLELDRSVRSLNDEISVLGQMLAQLKDEEDEQKDKSASEEREQKGEELLKLNQKYEELLKLVGFGEHSKVIVHEKLYSETDVYIQRLKYEVKENVFGVCIQKSRDEIHVESL